MHERRSPESVTEQMRTIWRDRGALVGEQYEAPPCPYTADELKQLDVAGRRPTYLPPELATQASRHKLGVMFPALQCYSLVFDNPITNDQDAAGWFDYDVSIAPPYAGTSGDELIAAVLDDGRQLMSLNQYLVASQDSKLLTGRYLDEDSTWSRVCSRVNGRMVAVRIDGSGGADDFLGQETIEGSLLTAYDMKEYTSAPILGGRGFGLPASLNTRPPRRHMVDMSRGSARVTGLDLDAEWQRQAAVYVDLGLPGELGLATDAYLASLPRFAPQPAEYAGRLDVPLLVETRVPWRRLAEMAGMTVAPSGRTPETPSDERATVPSGPYTAWVNDWGQRFPETLTPGAARAQLADDEAGGSAPEGVAMTLAHRQVFTNGRYWDLIGCVLHEATDQSKGDNEKQRTMAIYGWRGRPELAGNLHEVAIDNFRPLIRGTAIVTA